jgi:hypothetical protein
MLMEKLRSFRFPSVPALALYGASLVAEVPVIFARMLVTLAVAAFVLLVKEGSPDGAEGLAELGLIPTAWSIFALITPLGGGWWWRTNMGGREPSERERTAYQDALDLLRHNAGEPVRAPSGWFVIDSPQPDAAVCGDTLMLSRGLFESEYLPAVLAHELGHLNSSDGKLTAALNRVVIHPPPRSSEKEPRERDISIIADDRVALTITLIGALIWLLRKTVAFAKGGLGLRITAPFWGSSGANASISRTSSPPHSARPRSLPTSWRSTPSSMTIPSPSSGSPNIPTRRASCALTGSANPALRFPRK